ncbi:MAG TPA: cytochrome c [Pyrinomonadaceae bacterium]
MSRPEKQETGDRRQETGDGRRVVVCLLLTAYCLLLTSACRMDMQDQPRYEVYEKSDFFKDGFASRPFPEGTVARGLLREDKALYTGKRDNAGQRGAGVGGASGSSADQGGTTGGTGSVGNTNTTGGGGGSNTNTSQANTTFPDDVDAFPMPVTPELVARGLERYNIFCSACHGAVGYGDGMIVRRGYRRPPSLHEDRLRQAPVGHFFDVMTNGWGAMPAYAPQVPVRDRWAIVAYIRALQLSQNQQAGGAAPAAPTNPPVTERPESRNGGQR